MLQEQVAEAVGEGADLNEVEDDEVPGVVVSRVNLSPRFMSELIEAMQDNYAKWRTREGIKNLPETGERRDLGEPGGQDPLA